MIKLGMYDCLPIINIGKDCENNTVICFDSMEEALESSRIKVGDVIMVDGVIYDVVSNLAERKV